MHICLELQFIYNKIYSFIFLIVNFIFSSDINRCELKKNDLTTMI